MLKLESIFDCVNYSWRLIEGAVRSTAACVRAFFFLLFEGNESAVGREITPFIEFCARANDTHFVWRSRCNTKNEFREVSARTSDA
jgi:hypothetical protein